MSRTLLSIHRRHPILFTRYVVPYLQRRGH
jgi:hypothetical protein